MAHSENIKFQISVFGDLTSIKPTEEILRKCLEKFYSLGFVPGGNLQEMDPRTGQLSNRLTLQSMQNGVMAHFLNGRLDVVLMQMVAGPGAQLTLDAFSNLAIRIIAGSVEALGLKFNRIGFITERMFKGLESQDFQRIRDRFITPDSIFFDGMRAGEWQARVVLTEPDGQYADANINYNLAQARIQVAEPTGVREFDTIHVTSDINTPADRRGEFSIAYLTGFVNYSQEKEDLIWRRIEGVVNER